MKMSPLFSFDCVQHALEVLYLYACPGSASALNNIVASKYAAQGMCRSRKLTS